MISIVSCISSLNSQVHYQSELEKLVKEGISITSGFVLNTDLSTQYQPPKWEV